MVQISNRDQGYNTMRHFEIFIMMMYFRLWVEEQFKVCEDLFWHLNIWQNHQGQSCKIWRYVEAAHRRSIIPLENVRRSNRTAYMYLSTDRLTFLLTCLLFNRPTTFERTQFRATPVLRKWNRALQERPYHMRWAGVSESAESGRQQRQTWWQRHAKACERRKGGALGT